MDNNSTQRDPEGPDSDVASALNNNAQGGDDSSFSFSIIFLRIRDTKTFQIHIILQTK